MVASAIVMSEDRDPRTVLVHGAALSARSESWTGFPLSARASDRQGPHPPYTVEASRVVAQGSRSRTVKVRATVLRPVAVETWRQRVDM